MNILVVSRVSIPAKDRTLPAWEYLRSLGHTVIVDHPGNLYKVFDRPNVMISMGVSIMDETFEALERFPGVPLFAYNWDCYEWVWKPGKGGLEQAYHESRGKEYDYVRYGSLLRKATEVWVPSSCTGARTTQWWGLTNWKVILSACPYWDYEDVKDGGYALMTLREIPDPWWGMFEKCCNELEIPYKTTRHEVSYKEYQEAVANCRFLCAPLYELSTGGLTLMEGYYLGKPCLLSDSKWNGAKDYMNGYPGVYYFRGGDIQAFKRGLNLMWKYPPMVDREESSRLIKEKFSDKRMIDDMVKRIEYHLGAEK